MPFFNDVLLTIYLGGVSYHASSACPRPLLLALVLVSGIHRLDFQVVLLFVGVECVSVCKLEVRACVRVRKWKYSNLGPVTTFHRRRASVLLHASYRRGSAVVVQQ